MNDPFDCQTFRELCMDYRSARYPDRPQHCYEVLQEYCRSVVGARVEHKTADGCRCADCGWTVHRRPNGLVVMDSPVDARVVELPGPAQAQALERVFERWFSLYGDECWRGGVRPFKEMCREVWITACGAAAEPPVEHRPPCSVCDATDDEECAGSRGLCPRPDVPPKMDMQGWRSIETAPEHVDVLIGQVPSPMVWAAYRVEDEWYFPGDDQSFSVQPTHWRPLPAAPVVPSEGQKP